MEIRLLAPGDDRSRFSSGALELDRYFHDFAGQHQFKKRLSATYVAVDDGAILGFATVAAGHVERDELPPAPRGRLPRYPLPVLRLARLATDRSARGRGLGRELLAYVVALALRMSEELGCVAVVVDAKPDAVAFYEAHGFEAMELIEGESSERPRLTPLILSLNDLKPVV